MHPMTISIGDSLLHQARTKALREGVSLSEVVSALFARWVASEIGLATEDGARQQRIHLARLNFKCARNP